MKRKFCVKKKGFTLIELLVTIAVIGLLSLGIGTVVFSLIDKSEENSNKITYTNIKNASLNYVKEFKTSNLDWYDEVVNNVSTGNQFACITIQQLINKGFFKSTNKFVDETGMELDKTSSIKIVRDKNMVILNDIYSGDAAVGCDRTIPELEIQVDGDTTDVNGTIWYKESPDITLIATKAGTSGISEYIYYIDEVSKNIETNEVNYTINANQIISSVSGAEINVCGIVVNGNGIDSEKACKKVNIDITTPTNPVLTASDNISSGNWHKNSFDLNISGGGTSPSGTYYEYVINSNANANQVSGNKISGITSENDTYKVKTCNKVGRCSGETMYLAKVDDDAPNIISFVKSTEETAKKLTLTGKFSDSLSGVVKYKINKSASYVNSGWTMINASTSELTTTLDVEENSKYYLWVEDAVGRYNSKLLDVTNIDKEGPVYSSGGAVSISGTSGSITTATFTDKSTPITVYYLVKTTNSTPTSDSFASTSKTFTASCGNTYYAYAKAVDRLGNYTIKYLGSKSSSACCSEGTYSYYDCTSRGYKRNRRYNECTGSYQYQTTTTSCASEDFDCDSWGSCQSSGKKYRTCYYYYGGSVRSYSDSTSCTYYGGSGGGGGSSGSSTSMPSYVCSNTSGCSANGYYGGGECTLTRDIPNQVCSSSYKYTCYCCKLSSSTFSGGTCYKN